MFAQSANWAGWAPQVVNAECLCAGTDCAELVPYNRQMGSCASSNYMTVDPCNAVISLATPSVPAPSLSYNMSLLDHSSHELTSTAGYNPHGPRQHNHRRPLPEGRPLPMMPASPPNVDQTSADPQGVGKCSMHKAESPRLSIKAEPQQSPSRPADKPEDLSVTVERTGQRASKAWRRQPTPVPLKRHLCEYEGCGKRFAQKARLRSHVRVHTGEKPYPCRYGCGKAFTQPGNRNTHHRGHTGEAPYVCHTCGRRFQSGGNLKPHEKTHSATKDWICKLDNCGRGISTKGNLKTHQLKSHRATLDALLALLQRLGGTDLGSASKEDQDMCVLDAILQRLQGIDLGSASKEDQDMCAYLSSVHNNLNKGIKGSQGYKIRRLPYASESSAPSSPDYPCIDTYYRPYEQLPPVHLNCVYGLPAMADLAYQTMTSHAMIDLGLRMYDSDMDNMASPVSMSSPSSTATYDYEEEHMIVARQCRF